MQWIIIIIIIIGLPLSSTTQSGHAWSVEFSLGPISSCPCSIPLWGWSIFALEEVTLFVKWKKKSKIQVSTLQRHKSTWSVNLPSFEWYLWCFALRPLLVKSRGVCHITTLRNNWHTHIIYLPIKFYHTFLKLGIKSSDLQKSQTYKDLIILRAHVSFFPF